MVPCRCAMKDAGLKSAPYGHITQSIGCIAWCGKSTLVGVKVILDTKSVVLRAVHSLVVLYGIVAAILKMRQGFQKTSAVWRWKTPWKVLIQKKPPQSPEPKLKENVIKRRKKRKNLQMMVKLLIRSTLIPVVWAQQDNALWGQVKGM